MYIFLYFQQFKYRFRISRETCSFLIETFANSEYCPVGPEIGGSQPKTAAEHILIFLWYVN